MNLYVENPKESTEKSLEIIYSISEVEDKKSIYKNEFNFYKIAMNNPQTEFKKQFIIVPKEIQ